MGQFIDITGQRFGKLVVLKRAPNKNKAVMWLCQCDCGNQKIIAGGSLRSGRTKSCGKCLRNDAIDETGHVYGKLTVLERAQNIQKTTSNSTVWKCQCECGAISYLTGTLLRRSDGPRACRSCSQKINLVGQTFGILTVIEELPKNYYKCKCKCGNIISTNAKELLRKHRLSCGCAKSIGEQIIISLLNNNNIEFQQQKWFNNCRNNLTNNLLYFDFYLPNYNCLIEYDGGYHQFGWLGDEESKNNTQERDNFKNKWCKENNIPLIRIPYTHLEDICLEDLLPETSQFLI